MATTDRLLYISSDGLVRQLGFDPTAADLGGAAGVASSTHSATSKTTPVDADELPIVDSADSWSLKKLTWANLKATLKTYFDTLYLGISATAANASQLLGFTWASPGTIGSTTPNSGAFTTLSATGNATLGDAEATDTHAIKGATTVLANSANPALKVTQTGSGNAFVVEDSASTDSTPFVIDANGSVFIGHTSFLTSTFATIPKVSIAQANTPLSIGNYTADGFGARVDLIKSRSATINGQTVVQSGDNLGAIYFSGSDGTGVIPAALILAESDGIPGTNDMPGRLVFSTTADGASTPTERMRIDSSGNVLVTNVGGLGYGTGAGGTVTQTTSRTTTVTLNKPTGRIDVISGAGSATWTTFQVNNSLVTATDVIVLSVKTGSTNVYLANVTSVANGSFNISFATTGGTATDTFSINFAVIKGATS